MAFVRKKVKTFKWPVEVKEPSETKAGTFDSHEFTAIFNRVSRSVITDMAGEDDVKDHAEDYESRERDSRNKRWNDPEDQQQKTDQIRQSKYSSADENERSPFQPTLPFHPLHEGIRSCAALGDEPTSHG